MYIWIESEIDLETEIDMRVSAWRMIRLLLNACCVRACIYTMKHNSVHAKNTCVQARTYTRIHANTRMRTYTYKRIHNKHARANTYT